MSSQRTWILGVTVLCGLTSAGCGTTGLSDERAKNTAAGEAAPVLERTSFKPADVELKVIKYDILKQAVKDAKGRVLVVDIWSDF